MTYRLLEHTADIGLEAQGGSLQELFSEAAQALREVLFGEVSGRIEQTSHLRVTGQDQGELLVNWLNEILYLFEVQGIYPVSFTIEGIDAHSVCGQVHGELFHPERHAVERVVKAATYHQLLVERDGEGWRARVYLDL